jgi:hypothetical protein
MPEDPLSSVRDRTRWWLRCVECGRRPDARALGWRGYRSDLEEDGDPPELSFFCPACADVEFGRG